MTNKDHYQPETKEDVEADDELFGEVIEQSDARIEEVNVMAESDLSEASKPTHASHIHLANRKSNHAGIDPEDRPVATAPRQSMNGAVLTLLLLAAVVAGLYVLTIGGSDDPQPTSTKDGDAVEQPIAVPTPPPVVEEPETPPESDDGRGDGTPTLDVATLTRGMVAAGWRVGAPSVDRLDDVVQTNVLAQKDAMAATVTIYESKTWEWSRKLLLDTEPPAQGLSFGRTVVRVSIGPNDKQNGVVELFGALTEFKKAAREKAMAQGQGAPPAE